MPCNLLDNCAFLTINVFVKKGAQNVLNVIQFCANKILFTLGVMNFTFEDSARKIKLDKDGQGWQRSLSIFDSRPNDWYFLVTNVSPVFSDSQ